MKYYLITSFDDGYTCAGAIVTECDSLQDLRFALGENGADSKDKPTVIVGTEYDAEEFLKSAGV